MKTNKRLKGFTLIELLVVIAIIAILAVVVVLTLNPAQLLAQSRDSNRVSDFATLKSSIALYQVDVSTTWMGVPNTIYVANAVAPTTTQTGWNSTTTAAGWGFASAPATPVIATSSSRGVNGTSTSGGGWLPINFGVISSGAPFGSMPIDPLGNTSANSSCQNGASECAYVYVTNGTQYKLMSKMESSKYMNGGSDDVETGDGGNSTTTFEQGTLVTL